MFETMRMIWCAIQSKMYAMCTVCYVRVFVSAALSLKKNYLWVCKAGEFFSDAHSVHSQIHNAFLYHIELLKWKSCFKWISAFICEQNENNSSTTSYWCINSSIITDFSIQKTTEKNLHWRDTVANIFIVNGHERTIWISLNVAEWAKCILCCTSATWHGYGTLLRQWPSNENYSI